LGGHTSSEGGAFSSKPDREVSLSAKTPLDKRYGCLPYPPNDDAAAGYNKEKGEMS